MPNLTPQQDKLLMMGGMFENIIHQFKQPLNAIKTEATGLKFQKEINMLSDEEFLTSLDGIIESTNYLANTIDDFRNFLHEDKKKEFFKIKNSIEIIESIISPILKSKGIIVVKNLQDDNIEINGYSREFVQVLINIMNNAKDVIMMNQQDEKIIYIETSHDQNNIQIKIYDNGGGIPDDVIENIFDSHFTTKKEYGGTGIGLYMSKIIINDHFKGELQATNAMFSHNQKEYYGACFIIDVPKSSEEE
jgi:signal transduction histidine kinase